MSEKDMSEKSADRAKKVYVKPTVVKHKAATQVVGSNVYCSSQRAAVDCVGAGTNINYYH